MRWRSLAAQLVAALVLAAPLPAQQRLYVLGRDGNYHPVIKMAKDRPCIAAEGQGTASQGIRYALRRVDEYRPVFVAVESKEANASSVTPLLGNPSTPMRLNPEFNFRARFESDVPLADVFLVLALESTGKGRNLFAYEIGALEAGRPRDVSVTALLDQELGSGRYSLMVFVAGDEVFTSEQPEAVRDAAIDEMIARRIAGVQKANPQPLFAPGPRYPMVAGAEGLKGVVRVAMRISPAGRVAEPVIEESLHPDFDAAVLAVLPRWRFVPRVVDGQAVESRVKLPIAFAPPNGFIKP